MHRSLLALGCVLALSLPAWADVFCQATTALKKQSRTKMKHREPAPASSATTSTTVAKVSDFPAPAGIDDKTVRKKDEPLAPREEEIFTFEGDLWRVKLEDNDCDFHLELSGPDGKKTDDRVIAEISQGQSFREARDTLLQALKAAGLKKPPRRAGAKT